MTPAHIEVTGALALLMVLAWLIGARVRRSDTVRREKLYRVGGRALVALSLGALLAVGTGYLSPESRGDEGAAAHIFQLTVLAVVLVGTVLLSTMRLSAGWSRTARPLAVPVAVLALAFGALYYLEHCFH
jgi:hypothetical protein